MLHLHFVSKETTETGETFEKLRAFWRLVRDELQLSTKVFVVDCQPLRK